MQLTVAKHTDRLKGAGGGRMTTPSLSRIEGLPPVRLTASTFEEGLRQLAERDRDLAGILKKLGRPPMWKRKPGFATLVHIILEQQVSLASARAAMSRLLAAASPLTPERFLELDDVILKTIGFSRQKARYCRILSQALIEGSLNLKALEKADDSTVRAELLKVKGIGAWTADIYLLMALRRADTWPKGDLAIAVAVQEVKRLRTRPGPEDLEKISVGWRPWRAVAARLLWHWYLSDPESKK